MCKSLVIITHFVKICVNLTTYCIYFVQNFCSMCELVKILFIICIVCSKTEILRNRRGPTVPDKYDVWEKLTNMMGKTNKYDGKN